jgi:hypothetical protein
MANSLEMLDLARHLLVYETKAGKDSEATESATLRVYEKLRGNLCVFAGVAGFQSLAFRALTLAKSEDSSLVAVQVAADGNLQGMSSIEPSNGADKDDVHEGGVILIARLLGLLHLFVGAALTMTLIKELWQDAAFDDGNSGDGRKA